MSEQLEQAGQEIANQLNTNDWEGAAASLSRYANDLDLEQFKTLTAEISKHDNKKEGVDITPIYAVGRFSNFDSKTQTSTESIERAYVGTDVSVYLPDERIFGSTLNNQDDVAGKILHFGNIYESADSKDKR